MVTSTAGLLQGLPTTSGSAPRADRLAIDWLTWLRDHRQRSDDTLATYSHMLSAWLSWTDENGTDALSPSIADLEQFAIRPLIRGGRRSISTRRVERTALTGWFGWLTARGHIAHDPSLSLEAPVGPRRKRRPVPDEHWLKLWRAAGSAIGRDNGMVGTRLYLGLGLGHFCGLRLSEIAQLTGSHVQGGMTAGSAQGGMLIGVIRKGNSEHDVPWHEMVTYFADHPQLAHLLPDADRFVKLLTDVSSAVGPAERIFWQRKQTLRERMQELCDRVGIRRYVPHQLRHCCASSLVNEGGVPIQIVQELLNHQSINTTRGYIDVSATALRDWRRANLAGTS